MSDSSDERERTAAHAEPGKPEPPANREDEDAGEEEPGEEEPARADAPPGRAAAKPTVSEKIEEAIDGFVRFLLTLANTTAALVVPSRVMRVLVDVNRGRRPRKYLLPFTFLVVAYFPWAVVLSASASSYWEVLLRPESTLSDLIDKLSQSISPTKLLVTGVPVIITVLVGTTVIAWATRARPWRRELFRQALGYGFGMQFLVLSLALLALVATRETFLTHLAGLPKSAAAIIGIAGAAVFYPLVLLSVLYPSVTLGTATWMAYRRRSIATRTARTLGNAALAALLLVAVNYVGWLPGATREAAVPVLPATVSVDIDPDAHVRVEANGPRSTTVSFTLLIDNQSGKRVAIKRSASTVLVANPKGAFIDEPARVVGWSDGDAPLLVVAPDAFKWMRVSATFPNPAAAFKKNATTDGELIVQGRISDMAGREARSEWRTTPADFVSPRSARPQKRRSAAVHSRR